MIHFTDLSELVQMNRFFSSLIPSICIRIFYLYRSVLFVLKDTPVIQLLYMKVCLWFIQDGV